MARAFKPTEFGLMSRWIKADPESGRFHSGASLFAAFDRAGVTGERDATPDKRLREVTDRKWMRHLTSDQSAAPTPLALKRATHLSKARGLIPPNDEARSGLIPLGTDCIHRSRPGSVCLAFL